MSYLSELQNVIRRLHGVESKHVESVRVKETFQDKTVGEGIVEVFEIRSHPKASRVYAWSHETDDPKNPRRHVTVLHVALIVSAEAAVKAAIVQEFRSLGTEES